MDGLETRELRYFVAVAEELHFGRAAERLQMAQPPLSRAIRRLERRLGVQLLNRDNRGVSLTPAGETFLKEARRALDAVDAAVRRTRRAAMAKPTLVLITKAGASHALLKELLDAYAARPGPSRSTYCCVRSASSGGCCSTAGPTWRSCTRRST